MVLGAALGVEAVPADLRETLTEWKRCDTLLAKLPLLKAGKAEL